MKALRAVLPLVLSLAAFVPATAMAHGPEGFGPRGDHFSQHVDHGYRGVVDRGYVETRPIYSEGRYESRIVPVWVGERRVEEWVPRTCEVRVGRWHEHERCEGGYNTVRVIPGFWQNMGRPAWIPGRAHIEHRFGSPWGV